MSNRTFYHIFHFHFRGLTTPNGVLLFYCYSYEKLFNLPNPSTNLT
uniref:Uncharacterized protein n=1 Tax=Picea sitchensis TaxID=3332 RepID=A9P0Q0_PICSI|nr:unknown [Picea sitchensis]